MFQGHRAWTWTVSEGGLEPPRPCGHQPLKLAWGNFSEPWRTIIAVRYVFPNHSEPRRKSATARWTRDGRTNRSASSADGVGTRRQPGLAVHESSKFDSRAIRHPRPLPELGHRRVRELLEYRRKVHAEQCGLRAHSERSFWTATLVLESVPAIVRLLLPNVSRYPVSAIPAPLSPAVAMNRSPTIGPNHARAGKNEFPSLGPVPTFSAENTELRQHHQLRRMPRFDRGSRLGDLLGEFR
jgi:hypothetical protein